MRYSGVLTGYVMEIFVIHNSRVLPYILDPKFEGQLPVIPAQVLYTPTQSDTVYSIIICYTITPSHHVSWLR